MDSLNSGRSGRELKQHVVRLRQIERVCLRLAPAQFAGRPVDFDHVAVGILEIERERHTVVEHKIDRNIPLEDTGVDGSQLDKR